MKNYLWNLLISIDQFGNTLLGGHPDETLSSRCAKCMYFTKNYCVLCNWFCRLVDYIDPNHCEKSLEPDEGDIININKED